MNETSPLSLLVNASSSSNLAMRYMVDAASKALGMTVDPQTAMLSWYTREEHGARTYPVELTAVDMAGFRDTNTITITVLEANTPPEITSTASTNHSVVVAGEVLDIQFLVGPSF